jgi:hypothetical protein
MTRRKANPGQRPFLVSGDSMKRIAAAVQGYEHGNRRQSPVKFRTATGDDGGDSVRLGRISSEWAHGDSATVERLDEAGDPFDPSQTFEAMNFFGNVHVPSGTLNVACGLVGGTWILIEAERIKKTVVVDVRFEDGNLVKDLEDLWVIDDAGEVTTETIVETTECPG